MMNNLFPLPPQMRPQQQQMTGVNPQQFQQWLPQINQNMLQQLISRARQQGMSDSDIQAGLNFINSMRSRG
jgi:hypothetical protein